MFTWVCLSQFAVLLFLIFMMEVAGGVAGYLMQQDIDDILKTRMEALMLEYNKNTEITSSWNALQYDVSVACYSRCTNTNVSFAVAISQFEGLTRSTLKNTYLPTCVAEIKY